MEGSQSLASPVWLLGKNINCLILFKISCDLFSAHILHVHDVIKSKTNVVRCPPTIPFSVSQAPAAILYSDIHYMNLFSSAPSRAADWTHHSNKDTLASKGTESENSWTCFFWSILVNRSAV